MHFAVCSFLERPADGAEFAAGALPLHVTVLGNSGGGADAAELIELVVGAKTLVPLELATGTDERFGRRGEYHVTTLERAPEAVALHEQLLAKSRSVGAVPDEPDYTGDGFRPHITWVRGEKPDLGTSVVLTTLSLVDLEPGGVRGIRRVVATV